MLPRRPPLLLGVLGVHVVTAAQLGQCAGTSSTHSVP